MIAIERLREIAADPKSAAPEDIALMAKEIGSWRPVADFVEETLKAIYINAKEEEQRSLVLDVITSAARTCLKRIKEARAF
jgi:hypothetical protein